MKWVRIATSGFQILILLKLGLYIVYFKRYDTFHDTQYILSGLDKITWYIHKFHRNLGILMTKIL